jgi:hypothetical protein
VLLSFKSMPESAGLQGLKAPHELPRVLNISHATSIVVGIIIGSGIFLVPREMMAAVGSSGLRGVDCRWVALAVWRDDLCGDRCGAA